MKYQSWMRWVPGAAFFAPAPTREQIILHDLRVKKNELVEHELGKIKLQHERACLVEQFRYLELEQRGEDVT